MIPAAEAAALAIGRAVFTNTCATCHGRGQVRLQRGIFTMQQPCPHCGGRGKTFANPCKSCHGNGRVEGEKVLSVKVPAGVDSGAWKPAR